MIKVRDVDTKRCLDGIRRWVETETPSDDGAAVSRLVSMIQAELAESRVATERIAGRDGRGDHLLARIEGRNAGPGVLVMAHLDTVWPTGTLQIRPFRVDGDRAYGPGIYDMKAGGYLAFEALRLLARRDAPPELPVTLLLTSDEEIGSPTSRAIIEAEARKARYVLVPEPAIGPERAVVTARKGWGRFTLQIKGRSAHAGGNHRDGRSAVTELARQVLALEAMTDYSTGVTVNVGVVHGGTRPNVVPDGAEAAIDLRAPTLDAIDRAIFAIRSLRPLGADIELAVEGGLNRPPFERSAGVAALYERANAEAVALGFDLPETSRGGISDGNLAAALGVPTLDGLGCAGDGAHAVHEHILISSIPERLALLTRLMSSLP